MPGVYDYSYYINNRQNYDVRNDSFVYGNMDGRFDSEFNDSLKRMLCERNRKGEMLLKDLLIKLIYEDKNFAKALKRQLSGTTNMETEWTKNIVNF